MIADSYYQQVEEAYELRDMLYHAREEEGSKGILEYFEFFCEHMDIHPGFLVTGSRKQEYFMLRCQFSSFVREQSGNTISLKEIGSLLGGRDHTSIIHATEMHKEWMTISDIYAQDYNSLIKCWRLRYAND